MRVSGDGRAGQRFNTQPPEGGWGWQNIKVKGSPVSTHSHPKVAGFIYVLDKSNPAVSTHSHPKVAGALFHAFFLEFWFQHTATRRWLE